eukprot:1326014-Pyramimonas_sp.AAC.1
MSLYVYGFGRAGASRGFLGALSGPHRAQWVLGRLRRAANWARPVLLLPLPSSTMATARSAARCHRASTETPLRTRSSGGPPR